MIGIQTQLVHEFMDHCVMVSMSCTHMYLESGVIVVGHVAVAMYCRSIDEVSHQAALAVEGGTTETSPKATRTGLQRHGHVIRSTCEY